MAVQHIVDGWTNSEQMKTFHPSIFHECTEKVVEFGIEELRLLRKKTPKRLYEGSDGHMFMLP